MATDRVWPRRGGHTSPVHSCEQAGRTTVRSARTRQRRALLKRLRVLLDAAVEMESLAQMAKQTTST